MRKIKTETKVREISLVASLNEGVLLNNMNFRSDSFLLSSASGSHKTVQGVGQGEPCCPKEGVVQLPRRPVAARDLTLGTVAAMGL